MLNIRDNISKRGECHMAKDQEKVECSAITFSTKELKKVSDQMRERLGTGIYVRGTKLNFFFPDVDRATFDRLVKDLDAANLKFQLVCSLPKAKKGALWIKYV